jgi:hypothetical protein
LRKPRISCVGCSWTGCWRSRGASRAWSNWGTWARPAPAPGRPSCFPRRASI